MGTSATTRSAVPDAESVHAPEEDARGRVRRQRYARGEGDRLREDLLVAAADQMAEHGNIDAVSLRAVARSAGVSPTAVYRHFDDHMQLLHDAVVFCWTNFANCIDAAARSSPDPFVAFRAAGDAYAQFALEHPGQYRVMFSNTIDVGFVSRGMDPDVTAGMSAFETLVGLVTAMLSARDDPRDPLFVSVQVHTWIHGIVHLCGNHPDAPWPDTAALLDGLIEALRLESPHDRSTV